MKRKLVYLTCAIAGLAAVLGWLTVSDRPLDIDDISASITGRSPRPAAMAPIEAASIAMAMASGAASGASSPSMPVIERGVNYVPLDQQQLPDEWKQHLREQLRNLRETGSLSRGKITHEFSLLGPMADNLHRKGIDKLRSQLAIQPSELGQILGPTFLLVGADVQGKLIEDRGAAGFFQIHRNPANSQMVELSENQLDVLVGDGTVLAPELQNDTVAGVPATMEKLVDKDGAQVHNLQWAARNRTFHLTTKNMTIDETRQVAAGITQRLGAMPFDGWRALYEYDPENPMHRIARPEAKEPGRW